MAQEKLKDKLGDLPQNDRMRRAHAIAIKCHPLGDTKQEELEFIRAVANLATGKKSIPGMKLVIRHIMTEYLGEIRRIARAVASRADFFRQDDVWGRFGTIAAEINCLLSNHDEVKKETKGMAMVRHFVAEIIRETRNKRTAAAMRKVSEKAVLEAKDRTEKAYLEAVANSANRRVAKQLLDGVYYKMSGMVDEAEQVRNTHALPAVDYGNEMLKYLRQLRK